MEGAQAPEEVHRAKSSIFEESGTRQILSLGFGLLLGHWFQTSVTLAKRSQWNLLFASITPHHTVSSRISATMLSFIA